MPEGDTIHYAANRIRRVLAGQVPDTFETPHPRHRMDRWPDRLAGLKVEQVDAHGKHLFLRFEDGWTIHSHLRMSGSWRVFGDGRRWSRAPRNAWLVLRKDESVVVQFNGPVLELMHGGRARVDQRISQLGPDVVAGVPFDYDRYLANLRAADPTRGIADALLDQRILAGIGNLWKVEGCFSAQIDPWRPVGAVTDEEACRIVELIRPRMQQSALDGNQSKHRRIYGRAGLPCPRCGAPNLIRQRGQGDDNRLTYWCPKCQA